ncbi:DUF2953 domain-containing protein [Faecalimonas sp.]
MLHILCILLKIIGILILVLLGLFFLLTGIILFVPVRYHIEAKGKGTVQSLEMKMRFSWLLHLLSGYVCYREKKIEWQVRTVWKKWNVPEVEKISKVEIQPQNLKESEEFQNQKKEKKQEKIIEETKIQQSKPAVDKEEKQRSKKEKDSFANKFKKLFQKIKCIISDFFDKIKLLREKKDKVVEFLKNETHQKAWKILKKEIIRTLKHLRPKKIKGKIRFGFSDPYLTGKVLAIISMCYPFYGNEIYVEPDFENDVLEGEVNIKGHVRGICFLVVVFNIFRSKEIRQTYKNMQLFKL